MIQRPEPRPTTKQAAYNRGLYEPRDLPPIGRSDGPVADPPPGGLMRAICPAAEPGAGQDSVPRASLEMVARAYGFDMAYTLRLAGIARRTYERRASLGRLVRAEARGVIALASLFDGLCSRLGGPAAARAWLDGPHPGLPDRRRPAEFLETAAGQAMVRELCEREGPPGPAPMAPAASRGPDMAEALAVPAIASAAPLAGGRDGLLGWLRSPNRRLGGRAPAEIIATPWGAAKARALIAAARDGVQL